MSLRLQPPPREAGFRHVATPYGLLVLPTASKHRWRPAERPFRSLLLADDGRVLSAGLPKFANLGEPGFEDHDEALRRALREGEPVWLTDKVDGSLVIRSVVAGEVLLRTRGTPDGGPLRETLHELAAAEHPILLDPSFMPDHSLHFEFVSPQQRIVLRYERPQLVFLGMVAHDDLRLGERDEMQRLAAEHGLHLVASEPVPSSLKELVQLVRDMQGREGVVARLPGGAMVKLKSASYLTAHRLRSQMSVEEILRVIERHSKAITSVADFERLMNDGGADWEIMQAARPVVEAYIQASDRARERFATLDEEVLMACMGADRKTAIATLRERLPAIEHDAMLLLMDGREDAAQRTLRSAMIDEAMTEQVLAERKAIVAEQQAART